MRLRGIITYKLEDDREAIFGGEIEVDESYFGGKRKGKRGRGGNLPIFNGDGFVEFTLPFSVSWRV